MKTDESRVFFPQEHCIIADWLGVPPPDYVHEYDDWDEVLYSLPGEQAGKALAEAFRASRNQFFHYDAKAEAMACLTLEYGHCQSVLGVKWNECLEARYWITWLPYYEVYVLCAAARRSEAEQETTLAAFRTEEPPTEACMHILQSHWQELSSTGLSRWTCIDRDEPGLLDEERAQRIADQVWEACS